MTLEMYLLLSAVLFSLGLFAALSQRNLIAVLIGVEGSCVRAVLGVGVLGIAVPGVVSVLTS